MIELFYFSSVCYVDMLNTSDSELFFFYYHNKNIDCISSQLDLKTREEPGDPFAKCWLVN